MKAEVITIGDEILIGQIVNTNAAWLGEQLSRLGVHIERMVTIGDDLDGIVHQIDEAYVRVDVIIITGGMGPTHDDVTRHALARYFGVDLVFDAAAYEHIKERFASRGRDMPANNRSQAMIPEGFEAIKNPVGTAAGLWYMYEKHGKKRFMAVVPGVPHEMRYLIGKEIIPRLRAQSGNQIIRHRTLRTAGIGESHLSELLGDYAAVLDDTLRLAFLPAAGQVRLRLTSTSSDLQQAERELGRLETYIRSKVGHYIFGKDDETLASVIGDLLRTHQWTIATAESCTGGHVSDELTNSSGSSDYVKGGIVAYSNDAKIHLLGVKKEVILSGGAVSRAVAEQMASGVRRCFGADIGISTTGIAGPTGGTPEKPVGTVWIGYADAKGAKAMLLRLTKERLLNKKLTTTAVLNLVRLSMIT